MRTTSLLALVGCLSAILHAPHGTAQTKPPADPRPGIMTSKPGPWGDLEYSYIYVEAPRWMLDELPVPSEVTEWHFPGWTSERVARHLAESIRSPETLALFVEQSTWRESEDGVEIFPTEQALLALTPPERDKVYAALRPHKANTTHNQPVVIESGNPTEWFSDAGLRPELIELIARLSYTAGDAVLFSDLPLLLSRTNSPEEERRVLQALTRTRSLLLRLRLDTGTDIENVAGYYTRGFKRKDLQSIFDSLRQDGGIASIDIAHLLPPLPRKLLYTYPPLSLVVGDRAPDCHWTIANFFRYEPDQRFLDLQAVEEHLKTRYEVIDKPSQFGDVLLLERTANGDIFHSAVYIADDIYFTKNGYNMLRPWVLMRLDDMLARYSREKPYRLSYRRLKE